MNLEQETKVCFILQEIYGVVPSKGMVRDILNNCNQDFHDSRGISRSYSDVRNYLNTIQYIYESIEDGTYFDEE